MKYKKALLTVGAVGVLGTAGSFGTFAAFTDTNNTPQTFTAGAGTLIVDNDFDLPDLTELGTRETSAYNCNRTTGLPGTPEFPNTGSECWAGSTGKRAGSITITNAGTVPQDVYLDFDGPIAADNLLAENIIIDTSDADTFLPETGHTATRLRTINNAGPTLSVQNLAAGATKTIHFRAWLRERPAAIVNGDNLMQDLEITEKITVGGIEVGRDDLLTPLITTGADTGKRLDYGL